MQPEFDADHRAKVMYVRFKSPCDLEKPEHVRELRQRWSEALRSWHSPYKALIDFSNVNIPSPLAEDTEKSLQIMVRFLKGLFLRNAAGFGMVRPELPIPCFATREEAEEHLSLRKGVQIDRSDFRSMIMIENHFQTHVMELSFSQPVVISDSAQVKTLKDKITNQLMQWHSKWSLLIDCTHVEISSEVDEDLDRLFKYLRGFFMKKVIGYSPANPQATYPFEVFRARHKAAAALEAEGFTAGDTAQCRSQRSP